MKQYNILMIMADQMHKYALGKIAPYVKTPNLDRLAGEGTLFRNAYSNNPVCGPFRGILYSGMYSRDNGVQKNDEALSETEVCLPQELQKCGYTTSFVGKLHLGGSGNQPIPPKYWAGHEHFLGYQCYNGFLKDVCFYDEEGTEHRYSGHRTDITAQLGIERLQMLADNGRPFLHTIFFQAPHYPEQPLPEYERLYDGIEFPLPEQYMPIDPYTPTFSPPSPQPFEKCPDFRRYGNNIQMYLKLYYAMVTQIDANVGKIMTELERLGIEENTAVIFSSDHGDMQGSHGMKNKCLPYERSCGIPLIIKIPGMKQPPVVDIPVSAVDYYPTCMALAGADSCKKLPGQSLLPVLQGKSFEHEAVFAEHLAYTSPWYMLRDERYKLVIDAKSHEVRMLFDMWNDPQESRNLAEDLAHAEVRKDLYYKLLDRGFHWRKPLTHFHIPRS